MKLLSRFMGAVLLLAGVLPVAAEQDPQQVQVQTFGESIDVRVVNIETVVVDKKGERVRGLSAADFRLLVDGKEVPIEYCTEIEEGRAASSTKENAGAPVAAGEEVGRNYLIYVDDSFSVANVRDEALAKLQRDLTLLKSADRMAVLAFDGSRIDVLSNWTGDAAALTAALERARRRPTLGAQQLSRQRALKSDMDWVLNMDGLEGDQIAAFQEDTSNRISPEARTQLGRTAAAAAAALRGFAAPPGRKVMLMLSGAWSLQVAPQLYGPMIEAANRLGYTIYPADMAQSDARAISALGALAERTGGRVVVSAKMEAFREVVADTGSYYWIGFTPAWKADDHGHKVTVEPRRAELAVRARGGFSDLSKRTQNAMKAESVLLFGGGDGQNQDRRLIVRLGEPKRAGRGQMEIPVTLGVPVESLALTPKGGGYIAETPLAIVTMDDKGGRADLPASRLKVALKTPPRTGTYARFQTAIRVRDIGQRLVFSVQDPVNGTAIWGEAEFVPRQTRTAAKR
ncbi:MAG TPA: VWA domain-containing protein [Thermoanaerobaculia bacterium]|jgi:VWFA-related protein|nr:VWA domain-containing protein [Thermoanaerobaculia bacterium]